MLARTAGSHSPRTIMSASLTAIGPIKSGWRAATARRIRSAIRRSKLERGGLDAGLALVGSGGERTLSRDQPRDGMAARGFSRPHGKEPTWPARSALAAVDWTSVGYAAGASP